MKTMKIKSIAMAGVLSLSMLAGMPVMAATGGTTNMTTAPTVDKTVNYADGVTLPDDTNIVFTVTKVANADGVTAPDDGANVTVKAATKSDFTKSGDTAHLSISGLPEKVGEYTYSITENALTTDQNGYGWTKTSGDTYYLHVLVKKKGNTTEKEYFVTTTNTTTTDNADNKTYSDKVNSIAFTNKYTKKAANLTITKNVSDTTYEPKDQEYTFKVTFETNDLNPTKKYSYTKGEGTNAQTITSGDTLTLKNGEAATFTDIPAGTKVTVVETPVTNIKDVKIDVKSNGTAATQQTINKGADFTTGSVLIGEKTNAITFTNEYTDVTATGVVTNIAPYITMVVVAGAAIAVYVVLKKRLAR